MFRKTLAEKSIALILVLGVLMAQVWAVMPVTSVQAQDSDTSISGDLKYLIKDGEAQVITNFAWGVLREKLTGAHTIPDTIDGVPVTSIGNEAFMNCENLTSIIIPESVTSIGRYAFYHCDGLTTITIPPGVTTIEYFTFGLCDGLKSISIPQSVTIIDNAGFFGCTGLTSITIPERVTSIGGNAFEGCKGLTSITIPPSVTNIGGWAFHGCTSLTSITFESPTTVINDPGGLTNDPMTVTRRSAKIIGHDPSTAKTYAEKYGFKFEAIGGNQSVTPQSTSSNSSSTSSTATGSNQDSASTNNATSTATNNSTPTSTSKNVPASTNANPALGSDTFPDGSKYVGEMSHGLPNGQGTFTWPDGSKYIGNHKDGLKHGQGTLTLAEGKKYVGEWRDDKLNGQGSYTAPNGETYVGEYKNNNRDGQGTYTWDNGETYVGTYKNNKQDGQGTYTWPDGHKYVGQYKDGLKNGQGTFTWPNGQKYVGTWKDGVKYGEGTYYYPDGHQDSGQWQGDKFVSSTKANKPTATTATNNSASSAVKPTSNSASGSGVSVYVNNAPVSFPDQQPFIDQNGRTQVPLRAAGQAMGLAIDWDEVSKTVTLSKDGKTARLSIGSNIIYVDGKATIMDTSPMLAGGRTVLPFRYVAQAFGAEVGWDPTSKRATVSQVNNSTSQNTKSTENNQSFFGEWKITKTIGSAPVAGMTDDEAASYIGKKLIIAQNAFTDLDGSVVKNPSYKQKTVANEDFYTDWHMNLDAIGVKSSSINEIEISNASSYTGFYLIDDNNIIYALDGVFFKLQK